MEQAWFAGDDPRLCCRQRVVCHLLFLVYRLNSWLTNTMFLT
jgi:hypothetical protein